MPETSVLIDAREFESFIPAIDPRRFGKPAVIKGKNFLFDVDGPRSAFANKFYNWYQWDQISRRNIREFLVEDEFFYGTATGIYRINDVTLQPDLLLPITTLKPYWPWSMAKVGTLYYFAQHDVGLWQYDPSTGIFKAVVTPTVSIKGVCLAYGRLVVLSDTTVYWSALDDGEDLIPSLTTGAGFQALSILSRNAFRVDPVSSGIIVSTDKGLIKGTFVLASYIFKWDVLSRDIFVYSPNMGVIVPDTGLLIMDAHGFHITDGQKPTPWEPEMGVFLKDRYLTPMNKKLIGCVNLYYSHAKQQVFVGLAPNLREGVYNVTFVYNAPSGKWGKLDYTNHGIFEVKLQPYNIDMPGFMDTEGYMRHFGTPKNYEVLCDGVSFGDIVYRLDDEPPLRVEVIEGATHYTAISEIHMTTEEPVLLVPTPLILRSGLYSIEATILP